MNRLYALHQDGNEFMAILAMMDESRNLKLFLVSGEMKDDNTIDIDDDSHRLSCEHPTDPQSSKPYRIESDLTSISVKLTGINPDLEQFNDYHGATLHIPLSSELSACIRFPLEKDLLLPTAKVQNLPFMCNAEFSTITEQVAVAVQPQVMEVIAPRNEIEDFKSSIQAIITKLDKRSMWNGRKKATMLKAALGTLTDNDSIENALEKMEPALSWQRWFTLFQDRSNVPKNSLQVIRDIYRPLN
tara:strand:+ start:241 stop:972 length:732 start_codon:yes stop_codon:yes gene_type:complete